MEDSNIFSARACKRALKHYGSAGFWRYVADSGDKALQELTVSAAGGGWVCTCSTPRALFAPLMVPALFGLNLFAQEYSVWTWYGFWDPSFWFLVPHLANRAKRGDPGPASEHALVVLLYVLGSIKSEDLKDGGCQAHVQLSLEEVPAGGMVASPSHVLLWMHIACRCVWLLAVAKLTGPGMPALTSDALLEERLRLADAYGVAPKLQAMLTHVSQHPAEYMNAFVSALVGAGSARHPPVALETVPYEFPFGAPALVVEVCCLLGPGRFPETVVEALLEWLAFTKVSTAVLVLVGTVRSLVMHAEVFTWRVHGPASASASASVSVCTDTGTDADSGTEDWRSLWFDYHTKGSAWTEFVLRAIQRPGAWMVQGAQEAAATGGPPVVEGDIQGAVLRLLTVPLYNVQVACLFSGVDALGAFLQEYLHRLARSTSVVWTHSVEFPCVLASATPASWLACLTQVVWLGERIVDDCHDKLNSSTLTAARAHLEGLKREASPAFCENKENWGEL